MTVDNHPTTSEPPFDEGANSSVESADAVIDCGRYGDD